MRTVAGVFHSREDARRAAAQLSKADFRREQVNLMFPGEAEEAVHSIPSSQTEQPGMGGAIGGVLGGALGLAGGFELGTAATVLVPGVGPVLAIGLAAAAALSAAGAYVGAKAGAAAEEKTTGGIPADEIFFYEDALRQGRSVVLVTAPGDQEAERARAVLAQAGAESLDAAREAWWIGLRDAESEHYQALGHNFEKDHDDYRAGFETALRRECRGQPFATTEDYLRSQFPDIWGSEPFRRGYARGQDYMERRQARTSSGVT